MDNTDYYEQQRAKWIRKRKNLEKQRTVPQDFGEREEEGKQ